MDAARALYDQVIEGAEDPRELYLQLSVLYGRAGRKAEAEAMAAKGIRRWTQINADGRVNGAGYKCASSSSM